MRVNTLRELNYLIPHSVLVMEDELKLDGYTILHYPNLGAFDIIGRGINRVTDYLSVEKVQGGFLLKTDSKEIFIYD